MKRPWIAGIVGAVVALNAWGQLPEELASLEALARDEGSLVDAARRFDTQQKSLIAWDLRMAQEYFAEGRRDLAASKQKDAQRRMDLLGATWEFVLSHYPNNARANNSYGEYLYDYGDDQAKAIGYWRTAIRIDEKYAPAHNNLGIHYFHNGEHKKGLEYLQRALELDEDNPDFLFNMAQMHLIFFPQLEKFLGMPRSKIYTEAMRMSKHAAESAPSDYEILADYAVNFYVAENFGVKPDWEVAARAWQRAREQARNDAEVFYSLLNEARTWARAGRHAQAVKPLEEALAIRPSSVIARDLLNEAKRRSA